MGEAAARDEVRRERTDERERFQADAAADLGPSEATELRDRLTQIGERKVIEQDDIGAGREDRADLVEAIDLDFDEEVRAAFARAGPSS